MANTVTLKTINDGPRNVVIQGYIKGDGSGEETAKVIADHSALSAVQPGQTALPSDALRLMSIDYTLAGFEALLEWDATSNTTAWFMAEDTDAHQCFKKFGGIKNNAGSGITGDLVMTTVGLGANDEGSFVLTLKKGG
jgi:hypothetical protein